MSDLQMIEQYILEKKGVKITAIMPRNSRELQLFIFMAQVAKEYFENKPK